MLNDSVFNLTVSISGIIIFAIHIVNIALKKGKREDEFRLLDFFIFTFVHFVTFLLFLIINSMYTSDRYIIISYTIFYIVNNIEVVLLFRYARSYVPLPEKTKRVLTVINAVVFGLFVILDVINAFTGMFFTSVDGKYTRAKTMVLSQGYQFLMIILIFIVTAFNKKLNKIEKAAFAAYCFIPFVAIIAQNLFEGYAMAYLSLIFSIEVLFLFVNVSKNEELSKQQEQNKEAQIKIMLSQIQPHFIYNSLSSISTLILIDPPKAQKALDYFTEYLRHNLSSLTEKQLIPFERELNHIKTYVALEKIRFEDRIKIVYDVEVIDFEVPPLSIQPIVENAIKHGILKKPEGGILSLKTYEDDLSYVIEVTDDGVGFSMDDVANDEKKHFGLDNIRYRIEKSCGGDITIKSEPNVGTKIVVTLFKKE